MQSRLRVQESDLNEANFELQQAQTQNDPAAISQYASETSDATQQIEQLQTDIAQAIAQGCPD
jgi:hypothetical protein